MKNVLCVLLCLCASLSLSAQRLYEISKQSLSPSVGVDIGVQNSANQYSTSSASVGSSVSGGAAVSFGHAYTQPVTVYQPFTDAQPQSLSPVEPNVRQLTQDWWELDDPYKDVGSPIGHEWTLLFWALAALLLNLAAKAFFVVVRARS